MGDDGPHTDDAPSTDGPPTEASPGDDRPEPAGGDEARLPATRLVAKYGYVLAFALFLLALGLWKGSPSSPGPVVRTLGGLTALVLLYQAWFMVARTDTATDIDILIPRSNNLERLDTVLGAYVLAALNSFLAVLLAANLVVR